MNTPGAGLPACRRRFILLRGPLGDEIEVEMPGDVPLGDLLPDLLRALQWPEAGSGRPLRYRFRTETGAQLAGADSLIDAGVENADTLWASPEAAGEAPSWPPAGPPRAAGPVSAPAPAGIDLRAASLASPAGLIFELGDSPARIGRPDQHGTPDVDLTELEGLLDRPVSSRRHARIVSQADEHYLAPEATTNGTFVNGVEAAPGERRRLRPGDVIEFGFGGVRLTYFPAGARLEASFFET